MADAAASTDDGHTTLSGPMGCRMYRQTMPTVGDVVMIRVSSVEEIGVYGQLVEYDTLQGLVIWSDLTRRQSRGVKTLVRVGQLHPVTTLRIDQDHRYVDLSKTRTQTQDAKACIKRYDKSRTVHSIVYQISRKCGRSMQSIYEAFVWDLYDRFDHALDGLQLAASDPTFVLDRYDHQQLDPTMREAAVAVLRSKLAPRSVRVRAEIDMQCCTPRGVDAIKDACRGAYHVLEQAGIRVKPLQPGEKEDGRPKASLTVLSAPIYLLTMSTTPKHSPTAVMELFNRCITAIGEGIQQGGGCLRVQLAPCVVDDQQEQALQARMQQHEQQSRLISGDDDHSDPSA
jgi:translation initiation factor 2 subunit 1